MKDDILARIDAALAEVFRDAALSEFERVDPEETYESLVPKANALATALRDARAEIVRQEALIAEPPTDKRLLDLVEELALEPRPASDFDLATGRPLGPEPITDDEREDADREALAQTIGAVVVDYEDSGPHSQRAITLRDVCETWPDEIAAEVVASPAWRDRGRGPITDEQAARAALEDAIAAWDDARTHKQHRGVEANRIYEAMDGYRDALLHTRGRGPITDDEREALEAEVDRRYPPHPTTIGWSYEDAAHYDGVREGLLEGLAERSRGRGPVTEEQRIARLDHRQEAYKQDRTDWAIDHESAPEVASDAFFRGYDAAEAARDAEAGS